MAGAIGRACLAIFGLRDPRGDMAAAAVLADDLGVALQITNILRDVREDAANGRIYLPGADLRRFGLPAGELALAAPALLGEIERAVGTGDSAAFDGTDPGWRRSGRASGSSGGCELVPLLDRRSAACVLAMAGIYRRLLERIDAEPRRSLSGRMSLPAREKAWVAVRGLMGAGA